MKRRLNCVLLLLIPIFISCDKDAVDVLNYIIAGRLSPEILFYDVYPDTLITSWEIESNYLIDINNDNVDDLNISVLNQYIFGGLSLRNSELRVETLNDNVLVLTDSVYPLVLAYGDTITFDGAWDKGDLLLLKSSEECCPPTGNIFHEGNWLDKNDNYIAIKYLDKLGWLRIGIEDYTTIRVYEFALMS